MVLAKIIKKKNNFTGLDLAFLIIMIPLIIGLILSGFLGGFDWFIGGGFFLSIFGLILIPVLLMKLRDMKGGKKYG